MRRYKEVTAEHLREGYYVLRNQTDTAVYVPDKKVEFEKREYTVLRKTVHGTYIVVEPDSEET